MALVQVAPKPSLPKRITPSVALPSSNKQVIILPKPSVPPTTAVAIPIMFPNGATAGTAIILQNTPSFESVESGVAESLPSTAQRRDILKRRIQQRPSKQHLLTKHILLADPRVGPLVLERSIQLRKQSLKSNLNRKLISRPGPLDLVTRKILQVDEELEHAVQEGRLLFPTSSRDPSSSDSFTAPSTPPIPSPSVLLSSLRISKQEAVKEDEECKRGALAEESSEDNSHVTMDPIELGVVPRSPKIRKKHPYRMENVHSSPVKSKLKTQEYKRGLEYSGDTQHLDNHDLNLAQQSLLLNWKKSRHDEMKEHDGGESDSGETIPYSGSPPNFRIAIPDPSPLPTAFTASKSNNRPSPAARPQSAAYRSINRLHDLKVSDLKEECRTRGLHHSGTKGQLLDKLLKFEDEIVTKYRALFPKPRSKDEIVQLDSPPQHLETELSNTSSSASPATVIDDRSCSEEAPTAEESTAPRRHSLPSNSQHRRSSAPQSRHPSLSNGSQPAMNEGTPTQHRIQILTSNGQVVYATLRERGFPVPADGSALSCKLSIHQGQPTLQALPSSSDTFRFAHNGCGGQVTLTPQQEIPRPPSIPRPVVSKPVAAPIVRPPVVVPPSIPPAPPPPIVEPPKRTPPLQLPVQTKAECRVVNITEKPQRTPVQQNPQETPVHRPQSLGVKPPPPGKTSPAAGDRPRDSPNLPLKESVDDQEDFDLSDVLSHGFRFDEKTIAQHEELMRCQHKKIAQAQKELKKSQAALKYQQQLIITAKNAQTEELAKRTNGQVESALDAWLLQLDIKQMNRFHMQTFLQQRQQIQQLETLESEQRAIEEEEMRLQRDEHVEQAVQDIVRLIKQNSKTALLIVQLLRKYQLERNAAANNENNQEEPVQPTTETIPPTGGEFTVLTRPQKSLRAETVVQERQAPKAQARARVVTSSNKVPPVVVICDDFEEEVEVQPCADTNAAVDMEEIFKCVIDSGRTSVHAPSLTSNIRSISPSMSSSSSIHSHKMHSPAAGNEATYMLVNDQSNFVGPADDVEMEFAHDIHRPFAPSTDILMEAVESSGIEEAMSHENNNDMMTIDHSLHLVQPTFPELKNSDMDDLMDILREDKLMSRPPKGERGMYNGSEELSQVLGASWMEDAPGCGANHAFTDTPTTSPDEAYEDTLVPYSMHDNGRRQALSPFIPAEDMAWLDDDAMNDNIELDFNSAGISAYSLNT